MCLRMCFPKNQYLSDYYGNNFHIYINRILNFDSDN